MKKNVFILVFALTALFSLTSCTIMEQLVTTATPLPTYTPFPTYTPLPTYTSVPTATNTPVPTQVPPTASPTVKPSLTPTMKSPATAVPQQSGAGSTPVTWKNETSHIIKIVTSGAGSYTLTLQPHEERMVYWNAGNYTVTYYLDGSSSIAGQESLTVKAEEHNLYTLNFR